MEEKSEVIDRATEQQVVNYQPTKIFAPDMNILHTTISLCMFLISISAGEATREKQKLTAAIDFLGTPKAFSLQNVKFYLERAIASPKQTAFEGRKAIRHAGRDRAPRAGCNIALFFNQYLTKTFCLCYSYNINQKSIIGDEALFRY